jgi:hypothetical protein
MKKIVIFFLTYEGAENKGNRFEKKNYTIFTSTNKIIDDFYKWVGTEMEEVKKSNKEVCYIESIKIINL